MLPQLSGIPLQSTESNTDASRNISRTLPVGQNVSATVVAVSKDQVQPEIFRLKLEINNRLIQLGVFQALPVGQKINVNRQSDGQIQITIPQPPANKTDNAAKAIQPQISPPQQGKEQAPLKLSIQTPENSAKLVTGDKISAAVISSRPIYTNTPPAPSQPSGPQRPTGQTATVIANNSSASATAIPTQAPTTKGSPSAHNNVQTTNNQLSNTATTPSAQPITNSTFAPATQTQSQPPLNPPIMTAGSINTNAEASQKTISSQQSMNNQAPVASTANTTSPSAGQGAPQHQSPIAQPAPTVAPQTGPPSHHLISVALPNGSKIELTSPQPLPQGTQIQIVKTSSQDVHVLQLREPSLQPSSALERPAVQETLRNALPNQIPTAEAFNQLSQITAQTSGPETSQLSSAVKTLLQLFGVRPGSQEAPAQIKQNIEHGGLSTESNLSKGITPHPQEMKNQLQQLQKLADNLNLPAEQKERLEQLLQSIQSRVTSQQLNSLQQWRELPDGGFERVLQLDLPIKQGEQWENLELRLSREGGTNAAGEMISVWRVRLHFDLEEHGGVDAEIRLTDGHEISTLFWCENKETAERLRQRSDEFSERLRQCGFDSTDINWHEGIAPEQKQTIHKQLVDLHT